MALARVKTWGEEALLFSELNAEFDNILNGALNLISPLTGNLDFGGYRQIGLSAGTAASPSVQPTGDTNSGLWFPAADTIALALGGLERLRQTSAGVLSLTTQDAAGTPVEATAGLKLFCHNKSLLDNGIVTLPAVTNSGFGIVIIGSDAQHTLFSTTAAGVVTLISNTADVVANADTDAKLDIGTANPQEPIQVKNALGGTYVVNIVFFYD